MVREPAVVELAVVELAVVEPAASIVDEGMPWPSEVPRIAGLKIVEVAQVSANVGDAAEGGTFVAGQGDLHAVARAWISAAQARGFRVLAERFDERVHVASLIGADGERAHLLLQAHAAGELAGVFERGRAAQAALTGECEAVPQRERIFEVDRGAITHDGGFRRELVNVRVATRLGHDFDGDGELDVLVPTTAAAKCPGDVAWTVYLARGACGHAVGTVGPGELVAWDVAGGAGPRRLEFAAQSTVLGDGGVVRSTVTSVYEFSGSRYRRVSRTPTKGVCHHCAWEACEELR